MVSFEEIAGVLEHSVKVFRLGAELDVASRKIRLTDLENLVKESRCCFVQRKARKISES